MFRKLHYLTVNAARKKKKKDNNITIFSNVLILIFSSPTLTAMSLRQPVNKESQ